MPKQTIRKSLITSYVSAEEWLAGKNATPIQMSMRSGTKIRTYKPVVHKPSENAVVVSDKPNDKKFMFLSEETKPDYRPINRRSEIKPSPQIDHRPLGADSYNKSLQVIFEICFHTFIT